MLQATLSNVDQCTTHVLLRLY